MAGYPYLPARSASILSAEDRLSAKYLAFSDFVKITLGAVRAKNVLVRTIRHIFENTSFRISHQNNCSLLPLVG